MNRAQRIVPLVLFALAGACVWMVLDLRNDERSANDDDARRDAASVGKRAGDADDADDADGPSAAARAARQRHARYVHDAGSRTSPHATASQITGTVVMDRDDADGVVPAVGATLTLYVDDARPDEDSEARETTVVPPAGAATADANGRFAIDIERGTGAWRYWRLIARTEDGLGSHARGSSSGDIGEIVLYELGHMRLTVSDEDDGHALPDAYAYLYAASFGTVPYAIAKADAGGVIEADPSPGAVLVTAPGHGFAEKSNPAGDVHLQLGRGLDLAGHVVDDRGAPLADLRLVVDDDVAQRATHTDEEGAFRFERLSVREAVYVQLSVNGLPIQRIVGYGDLDARIVIPHRGDIAGTVVFADGSPAVGAEVEGQKTDEEGHFVLYTDGRVRTVFLVASVTEPIEGFDRPWVTRRATQHVTLRRGATSDVQLVLEEWPHSFVSVRVLDPSGGVVPDAIVYAPGLSWHAQEGEDALRLIVGAAPGSDVRVLAYPGNKGAGDLAPATIHAVTSARWDDPPAEIRLGRTEPITVRVFAPDGTEIERSEWTALHVEGGRARLLPGGRIFAPTGAYVRIVVETRGLRFDGHRGLPTASPYELRIEFPRTTRVVGRLVRADGTPAPQVLITVDPAREAHSYAARGLTAADGSFAIDGVPVGPARVHAWHEDDETPTYEGRIDVPAGGALDLGDLLVWESVELIGRVIVPTGASPAGLAIYVAWRAGPESPDLGSADTATQADGVFRLRVPGASHAYVTATRRGRLFGVRAVDLAREHRADVRVTRVGSLRLLQPTAWGRDPFDIFVAAPDHSVQWEPDSDWTEQGRVTLVEDVPSGTWLLRVIHDGKTIERAIQVAPESETTIDLRGE